MTEPEKRPRRSWGQVRPSGRGKVKRFQASYIGPDMKRHAATETFTTKTDAHYWLKRERERMELDPDNWAPPKVRAQRAAAERERSSLTVREMCEQWLTTAPLKSSTVSSHRKRLELRVYSTDLADEPVTDVDRARIRVWWADVQRQWPDTGSTNSYAYKRLRTAFQWAVEEAELLPVNPVRVKGAGTPPRSDIRDRPLITTAEARALAEGVTDRMTVPVELLLWCGLRIGEVLELRRKDIHGLTGDGPVTLRIRRDAVREEEPKVDADGEPVMNEKTGKQVMRQFMVSHDTPKTSASNRDVGVPAQVAAHLRDHVRDHMGKGPEALVIPTSTGEVMLDTGFRSLMSPGKTLAGRKDVGPHDCRRFYCTLLVNTPGVSLEEARRLVGHEDVSQLMEYQRAASGYATRAATAIDALIPGATEDQDDTRMGARNE